MISIGVVIVTFNRLEKLKIALSAFDCQTKSPGYIIVVDNASTDETPKYLKKWGQKSANYKKFVIKTKKNIGGSGGFYEGLKFALSQHCDWIWVSDDDAFPEKNALEVASKYIEKKSKTYDISAVCGSVINYGKYDLGHRRNIKKIGLDVRDNIFSNEEDYKKKEFEIQCFSYVGAIINKKKLKQVGLPNKEYFIWYDDTEHSLRLNKAGKIFCVPKIKVHHDVGQESSHNLSWKSYYGIRNCADMIKTHYSKSCFYYFCFKWWLKSLLKSKKERDLILTALKDARYGNFGISNVYYPGAKI